jgi:tRNA-guanine family transglycosylase
VAGEILGLLLCTHHNLHFLLRLTAEAREAILEDRFPAWSSSLAW